MFLVSTITAWLTGRHIRDARMDRLGVLRSAGCCHTPLCPNTDTCPAIPTTTEQTA